MKRLILSTLMVLAGLLMSTIQAKAAKPLIVNDPYVEYANSATIFVKSVELHPDSTVLHIKAFYPPHEWIKIGSGSTLIAGNKSHKMTSANGIDLDKKFRMPSSGEAEFTLTFEPLSLNTKVFDFKEGDTEDAFYLRGIHTDKTFDNAPIDKTLINAPRWEKGVATIKGKIFNYIPDPEKTMAKVYPRSALGRRIDKSYGFTEINPDGTFEINLELYQSTQPCFIDIPGLYGVIYLSVGEDATVTVDAARRYAYGHLGEEGSVFFTGINGDINNQLTSNAGHGMIWCNYSNYRDRERDLANSKEFKADVMRFRDNWLWCLAHMPLSDEVKMLLAIDNDVDCLRSLSSYIDNKCYRDKDYYDYFENMDISDPMAMFSSGFDSAVNELRYMFDGYFNAVSSVKEAGYYEYMLQSGMLDDEETELARGLLKYCIERMPADVVKSRKAAMLEKAKMIPDTVKLNNADNQKLTRLIEMLDNEEYSWDDCYNLALWLTMSAEQYSEIPLIWERANQDYWDMAEDEFFEINREKFSKFRHKYNPIWEEWHFFENYNSDVAKMRRLTGLDSPEIEALMLMGALTNKLEKRELLPDTYMAKAKEMLPELFYDYLAMQNEDLKKVLKQANVNVHELSEGIDAKEIMLELVNKFPGKVLFIDIWGTWCSPCMSNITEMEPIKSNYANDVVFIYLADETSPKDKWEEKIKSISGEHYRLNQDKMQALMVHFGLSSYPSHIVIDREGNIVFTGHLHLAKDTRKLLDTEITK